MHYATLYTSSSCVKVTTATIPKKHNSNHLSVHQWLRSAIRDSQQPTSPTGFLFLKLPPRPCAVLLVHRNTFTQRCFTQRWLHIQKHFYTYTILHFTQRWFYAEQLYAQIPLQTEVLLQRNEFTRGAFIEGSLEVKLRTIWTDGKAEVGRVSEEKRREAKRSQAKPSEAKRREEKRRRREEAKRRSKEKKQREDQRRERVRGKKMQVREKVAKSRNTVFFQWYVASGGSASRVAKAAGAEPWGQMRDWKVARRCGAKHMSKSKCIKITRSGPLEVEMLKKCTPLWREAHFKVKSVKNWRVRSTFGRSDAALRGRRNGFCTLPKVSKTWRFCSSFNYNHHYTALHYTTLHSTQLQVQVQLQLHYATLRYANYITLQYTTLHHTTLH